ncbi:hypothetical protein C8A00DRAFT_16439 [Chaetomidium leptoderma]|uniref:Uncharacterized protein n=1 Tax=Chaetomidium leptoderma TaxID=669021 RepID=A0AAN6VJ58_9PEZI|nr:hypothetical protein C8A00DRAFT_16439 [Chaetomidium leptoderma]
MHFLTSFVCALSIFTTTGLAAAIAPKAQATAPEPALASAVPVTPVAQAAAPAPEPAVAVAVAPAANQTATTAPSTVAPNATVNSTAALHSAINPNITLPDAICAMNATVYKANAANVTADIKDNSALDDLQKLLNIIANHVERMRKAIHGNVARAALPEFQAPALPAEAADFDTMTAPSFDSGDIIIMDAPFDDFNTMTAPSFDSAEIMDAPFDDYTTTVPGDANPPGLINITCKGIGVCNPVTIIKEKDGKKIKVDKVEKLHKAAENAKKKAGKKD